MERELKASTLLLALFAASLAVPKNAAPQLDVSGTLPRGGRERAYRIHIPRGYDVKRPAPLVLALHGGGATGRNMNNLGRLNDAADKFGFLVVSPDGLFRHWNDDGNFTPRGCCRAANLRTPFPEGDCTTLCIDVVSLRAFELRSAE